MLTRLALVVALVIAACADAAAQRVALVIGNGAYRQVPALTNPPNDARDVHAALTRLGFESELVLDADRSTLETAIRRFGDRAVGADAALLYYAGHAVEVAGHNYMIPVTANLRSDRDLPFEAVDFDTVMGQLEGRARVILLFLDACRDNPFRLLLAQGTRGIAGQGLAAVRGPVGTLVAFSTAPGTVAQDGVGRNSPFTAALLKHIETPGLEVRSMLGRVRQSVREATGGAQVPWENSSLEGEFYFNPGQRSAPVASLPAAAPPPASPGAAGSDAATERLFWESIRDSRSVAEFEAYLGRYPNGVFSELARTRIAALGEPRAPVPAASAPRAALAPRQPVPTPAPPVAVSPAAPIPGPAASAPRGALAPTQAAPIPAPPIGVPPQVPTPPLARPQPAGPQAAPTPAPQQQAAIPRPLPSPAPPPVARQPQIDPGCVVVIHTGLDRAAGAPGRIEMRNTGGSCSFVLVQDPMYRNPYRMMWLGEAPRNGEVTFDSPTVRYRPKPGFHGEDRFTVETVPDGRLIVTVVVRPPG